MTEEIWKTAPRFERYEVSSLGRVRHAITKRVRIELFNRTGYPSLNLSTEKGVKRAPIHRLVCEAFWGVPPEGKPWVLHRDGNPGNSAFDNLYWGDTPQNQRDSVEHGTHPMSRRTHCPRGHEYNDENTYYRQDSRRGRNCRTCARDYFRRRKEASH